MRVLPLVLGGVFGLLLLLAGSDAPDIHACPPSGGHHGNQPYGSTPRQYVRDDQDPLLLGRDLQYDCTPTRCPELHTDYKNRYAGLCQRASGGALENTECGNFCFYAVCMNCTYRSHLHPRHSHTHGDHCEGCTGSHTHWHRQPSVTHGWIQSPCTDWRWRLYDPTSTGTPSRKDGRSDRDDYSAPPSIADTLSFGMIPPGYSPEQPECVTERGDVEDFDGGLTALTVPSAFGENRHRADIRTGLRPHAERVTIGDLSHLPTTPGEPGAPTLDSLTKVDDRTVTLNVSGGVNTQYRYWSYNGIREVERNPAGGFTVLAREVSPLLAGEGWNPGPDALASPLVFRVPFEPLSGDVSVDAGIRGIVSFQVRSVDADGVPSGVSNIMHEMIGVDGLRTIGPNRALLPFQHPLPPPPPDSTPLPTPSDPMVFLPATPSVTSVEQVVNETGTIEVTLGGSYSPNTVEYRIWDHSGFDPWDVDDVPDMSVAWVQAPVTSGSFQVSGVLDGVDFPLYDPVNPNIPAVAVPPATPSFVQPTPTPGPTRPAPHLFPTAVPPVAVPAPEPTPPFPAATPIPARLPIPVPVHFNVQVRLVDADGLAGNPSSPVVVRVWTGLYTGWDG